MNPPTNLRVVSSTSTTVTLAWDPPVERAHGMTIRYSIRYRRHGQVIWSEYLDPTMNVFHTISDLNPGTNYDMEIIARGH